MNQNNPKPIKVMLTWFLNRVVEPHQLPRFRSEINRILDWKDDRFHNHIRGTNQTNQVYPLIQFRSLKLPEELRSEFGIHRQLGAILSINEANDAVENLIENLKNKPINQFLSDGLKMEQNIDLGICPEPIRYKINHWLAVADADKFELWKKPMLLTDRISFLEEILYAQIEDFCREIGYWIPKDQLRLNLYDYQSLGKVIYPNDDKNSINFEAFDLIYEANIVLPDYIGMGKGKSKGFGWQTQSPQHQLFDKKTRPKK